MAWFGDFWGWDTRKGTTPGAWLMPRFAWVYILSRLKSPLFAWAICGCRRTDLFSAGSFKRFYRGTGTFGLFVTAVVLCGCPGAKVWDLSTFEEGGVSIAVLDTGKLLLTAAGTYQPRPVIGYELHILGLDDSAGQEWMVDVRGGTSLGASGHAIVTPSRFFVPTVQRADIAGVDFGFLLYVYGFDLEGRLDWENRYGQFTLRPYASALMNDMLYLAGVEQISRFEERQFVLAISVEDGTEQWIRTPDFEQEGTWIGDLVGCATENLLYGVAAKLHTFSTTEHFFSLLTAKVCYSSRQA